MNTKKLATALVLGALALAPMAQSSQAADSSDTLVAPGRAQIRPLIQGVVVDKSGHFLDNVDVAALRANGNPEPAASMLTYASMREDGPQHGYFFLDVGKKGDFTLTLSKKGYVTRTFPVGEVGKRQIVSLGEITLTRIASTATSAKLKDASISPTDKGKVTVTVSTKATKTPAGDVEVRDGNKVVGSDTLGSHDKGAVTVTLKKLAKGTYDLKAYFLGSSSLLASTSKAVTLTVKKARHRPNAW
ncbi:MAG: hypothetical protein JWR85_3447 [Marmoricola sp.]|nr:hypothetical protein [Marmoricola sp.]